MRVPFDNDIKVKNEAGKIFKLNYMEVYAPVHRDVSFNITLTPMNTSGNEDEADYITFYPMTESIKQALEAQYYELI